MWCSFMHLPAAVCWLAGWLIWLHLLSIPPTISLTVTLNVYAGLQPLLKLVDLLTDCV